MKHFYIDICMTYLFTLKRYDENNAGCNQRRSEQSFDDLLECGRKSNMSTNVSRVHWYRVCSIGCPFHFNDVIILESYFVKHPCAKGKMNRLMILLIATLPANARSFFFGMGTFPFHVITLPIFPTHKRYLKN